MSFKNKQIVNINVSELSDEELSKTMTRLKDDGTFYIRYKGVLIRSKWEEERRTFGFCYLDLCKALKGITDHETARKYAQSFKQVLDKAGVKRHKLFFQTKMLASEGGMHYTDCVDREGWIFIDNYIKYGKNGIKKFYELDLDAKNPKTSEKKEEVKPVTRDKEDKHIPRHIEEMFSIILNYLNK